MRGNQWMFRMGHPMDHPLRIRPELLTRTRRGTLPYSARGGTVVGSQCGGRGQASPPLVWVPEGACVLGSISRVPPSMDA